MATTDAKPGFRLPWSADRNESEDASGAPDPEVPTDDHEDAALSSKENETTEMIDAAPAASDHATHVADVDASASTPETATPEAAVDIQAAVPSTAPTPAVAPARKQNKFMADLTKAMQKAAESARSDTLARFGADAKAHIEGIHASTATEATELRKRADDDVAAIREWSKQEIARIREETDERIAHRKTGLEREIDAHAAEIEARIERVQVRVNAFEAEMSAFFERLLAEDDPTRFAAMAESLPEPPVLETSEGVSPTPYHAPEQASEPLVEVATAPSGAATPGETESGPEAEITADQDASAEPAAEVETIDPAAGADADGLSAIADDAPAEAMDPRLSALGQTPDFAAAEAEAAAFSADAANMDDDIPTIADDALAARLAGLVPDADEVDTSTTRVVVTGLVSVASIAGFKRHVSRIAGVHSVGVSSGPDGEFIFAVGHDPATAMRDVIPTIPGFAARVTAETEGELTVAARDPETEG